jgi:UDP-2-acetamido-3-amino-2,3-dideoxy-glucuronate N-acetyltransferase
VSPKSTVAIVGCGAWGKNLLRNLAGLGALRAAFDESETVRQWVRDHHPGVRVHESVAALLDDRDVAGVVIATPAATHATLVRQALDAGRDVFVEKPLALDLAEGQRLADLARRRGRILMVGHLLEYHPAVARLRELVAAGELGQLQYVYSNRLNLGRIRTEENALWSFAPHDIHVILRLLGEPPVEVTCQGGSYLQRRLADVTMTLLSFASGVRAHVFVSWLHPYKEQKLVVVGDRGMAVFDDTLPSEKLQLFPHRVDWVERMPVAVKAAARVVPVEDVEPLRAECAHFLDCMATRRTPRTDGDDGVAVLRVLDASQRSLDAGGVPVRLAAEPPPGAAAPAHFVHPTAVVDAGAEIGAGTRVWHFAHVMGGARIGRGCSLGQNVFVGRDVVIGDNVKIQNNVSVYEGVVLEDDVFCGPSMVFTNVVNPRSHVSRKHEFQPTHVRQGATLGANATVLCGHTIGRYAFVAAGAVVTRDVPDHGLVMGAPARLAGWMCRCGVRLHFADGSAACGACGEKYRLEAGAAVGLGAGAP